MSDENRARSVLSALTSHKEVPLVWLLGGVAQGLATLVTVVWMAATLVSDVNMLKDGYKDARSNAMRIDGIVGAQAAEVQRATDVNAAQNARLDDHAHRIEKLEDREHTRRQQ